VRVIDPPFSLIICFSVLRAVDTGQVELRPAPSKILAGATHRAQLGYRKAKEKDDRHKFKKFHGAPQFLSFFSFIRRAWCVLVDESRQDRSPPFDLSALLGDNLAFLALYVTAENIGGFDHRPRKINLRVTESP
jgi:hypothetical protein